MDFAGQMEFYATHGMLLSSLRAVYVCAARLTREGWTIDYQRDITPNVLPTLRVGQIVTARLDAFPDRTFRGRIASLNPRAEFTPRVALTEDEREDLLFGVRVEFDDPSGMLKAGLPLTVELPAREPRR